MIGMIDGYTPLIIGNHRNQGDRSSGFGMGGLNNETCKNPTDSLLFNMYSDWTDPARHEPKRDSGTTVSNI